MTKAEFSGPGLSDEQWDRLRALATTLTPEQSTWVGGYFTGFGDGARAGLPPVAAVATEPAATTRKLTVLYGSETGTGATLAGEVAGEAATLGLVVRAVDMADYKPSALKQEQDLLVITSTHGEGEPPQPAAGFFEFLAGRKAPSLDGMRFAVLALGDSTYEFFCGAGRTLDARFEALGAERLAERIECDVDQVPDGRTWARGVLDRLAAPSALASASVAAPGPAVAPRSYDQANPFLAPVLDNIVITGRGSSKETRHIELDLAGSGLAYEPGDALGIVAPNDPAVVEALLGALALDGETGVSSGGGQSLRAALATGYEIATATPRFLAHWAGISGAAPLAALGAPERAAERLAYLEANHVVDIVRQYPVTGVDAEALLTGLRRLQPRLYSIASCQATQDGDVHLTVSTVRYSLHGSERLGVASGWLGRLEDDTSVPVYVKANPHFRLPADDVPIIMVGAGTGVAPYRAFVQAREQRGARGKSRLFFGDRNFRSDFLYQTEWQAHLKSGALTRMDVAFSRDGEERAYVQHRLREAGAEVFAWLEEGAHFYVCGDAKGMAPDVHATLVDIVATAGGLGAEAAEDYVSGLMRDGRYQRDVY